MYQQTPGLRFQRKLEAMTSQADHWHSIIDKEEWPGLSKLLEEFSAFSTDYISLLDKIPESIARRPFVLNMGIKRLLQEWSILSRACEQRFEPEGVTGKNGFQQNLREAGKLVANYCNRWHHGKPVKEPYLELREPIVYFEKLYGISRAIYAPEIPVVSIPLTDYNPEPDYNDETRWQALAHELGHHIYWNGVDLKTSKVVHERLHDVIADALSASPPPSDSKALDRARLWWARLWGRRADRVRLWGRRLEEICADIFGILLAGPAYAVSAQDMAADRIGKIADLTIDDQEHPCPYLRPLIALQVLREIASHSSTFTSLKTAVTEEKGMIERLEDRWMKFCQGASGLAHAETGLTMEDMAADIPSIVQAILYKPVWPHGKSLWDLIEFYGKEPEKEVEALARTELTPLAQISDIEPSDIEEYPPADIAQSSSFKRIWEDLKDRVDDAELEERLKPLFFWPLLLGMDLSEAKWYDYHECTAEHWHFPYCGWWRAHKHPQDGSTVICC